MVKKEGTIFIILCLLISSNLFAQFQRKNPTYPRKDSVVAPTNNSSSPKSFDAESRVTTTTTSFNKRSNIFNKIAIGGNTGLNFGTVTYINLSPMVGYRLTDRFMPGIGLTYMYYAIKGYSVQNYYGGSVFVRYTVFRNFFVMGQLQALNVNTTYSGESIGENRWAISPLIGGGYIFRIGKNGGIMATLMYNLNYNPATSIYSSPLITNLGFIF